MKKFALTAAMAALAIVAAPAAHAHEIYANVGTEGGGVGYGYSINSFVNVRGEFDGMSFSHSFDADDVHYDGKVNLYHGGLYADVFPVSAIAGFRVTAGLLVGGDNISADATSMDGTYTINGVTVPTNGETIHAKAKFPAVRPYLGIGFGHNPMNRGLSMFFDAGVAFGKPSLAYDVPADIAAAAGAQNVAAEEASLQDKLNKVKFYPIVKIGLSYHF